MFFMDEDDFEKLSNEDKKLLIEAYKNITSDKKEWLKAIIFGVSLTFLYLLFLYLSHLV